MMGQREVYEEEELNHPIRFRNVFCCKIRTSTIAYIR
jgi:hypothetical protein